MRQWGNPFVIGKHGTREDVIARFRAWIVGQAELMACLHELRGKNLVCFCRCVYARMLGVGCTCVCVWGGCTGALVQINASCNLEH